jgi:hypothetical protein
MIEIESFICLPSNALFFVQFFNQCLKYTLFFCGTFWLVNSKLSSLENPREDGTRFDFGYDKVIQGGCILMFPPIHYSFSCALVKQNETICKQKLIKKIIFIYLNWYCTYIETQIQHR